MEEKKEEENPITLAKILYKGNKLEIQDIEALGLHVIPTRKEVKNTSLVRNIISTYEDRYLCLVNLNTKSQNQPNQLSTHLIVFKKNFATGQVTKKRISAAA